LVLSALALHIELGDRVDPHRLSTVGRHTATRQGEAKSEGRHRQDADQQTAIEEHRAKITDRLDHQRGATGATASDGAGAIVVIRRDGSSGGTQDQSIPSYSAAFSRCGGPARNWSNSAASSALAAVRWRTFTWPNPRIFSGMAARPTAR